MPSLKSSAERALLTAALAAAPLQHGCNRQDNYGPTMAVADVTRQMADLVASLESGTDCEVRDLNGTGYGRCVGPFAISCGDQQTTINLDDRAIMGEHVSFGGPVQDVDVTFTEWDPDQFTTLAIAGKVEGVTTARCAAENTLQGTVYRCVGKKGETLADADAMRRTVNSLRRGSESLFRQAQNICLSRAPLPVSTDPTDLPLELR